MSISAITRSISSNAAYSHECSVLKPYSPLKNNIWFWKYLCLIKYDFFKYL